MPTFTPNYNLAKPLVNSAVDQDLWGNELNSDMDIIDTVMKANADAIAALGAILYPVGTYYWNETDNTNPATLFGFGTWVAVEDKFIVARGVTYTGTGGAATVTLSIGNMPPHNHTGLYYQSSVGGGTGVAYANTANPSATSSVPSQGSATPFDIIPPYQAAYCWKRTV